jgi:hypothetical protein
MALATTSKAVTKASTTPAPQPAGYVVKMAVSLPLTIQQFNSNEQLKFKQSVALAAGVSSADVSIDRIVDMNSGTVVLRRLLATGIRVDTSTKAPTEIAANAISTGLTVNRLNSALVAAGLPAAAFLEPQRDAGSSPTNTIYIGVPPASPATTTPVPEPAVVAEATANVGLIVGVIVVVISIPTIAICCCVHQLRSKKKDGADGR